MALRLKPFQLMALLKPVLIGIDGVCRRVLQCCLVFVVVALATQPFVVVALATKRL